MCCWRKSRTRRDADRYLEDRTCGVLVRKQRRGSIRRSGTLRAVAGPFRVGVDIGGTFTDVLAMDERSGRTSVLKLPSTASPVEAVVEGIRELNARDGIEGSQIGYFAHGTTIGINTLLQRSGARVGVLTTHGFRDVLELRRLRLPSAQDFFTPRPRSLVLRRLVREIDERMLANGQVYRRLERDQVLEAVEDLLEQRVEAL